MYLRPSPTATTWETYGMVAAITPSTFAGATYFPPEVFIRSFLRSVMVRKPSASSFPMSPVWNQPSTSASAVRSGSL